MVRAPPRFIVKERGESCVNCGADRVYERTDGMMLYYDCTGCEMTRGESMMGPEP